MVSLEGDSAQESPKICNTIDNLLPVSLLAGGTLLLLMGFTTISCLINIISKSIVKSDLIAVALLYCNPLLSSSFNSYSHFLQLALTVAALLAFLLREDS